MNDVQKDQVVEQVPVASGYSEKISAQMKAVDQLNKEFERSPTPELALQLSRRRDTVAHLKSLEKGDPRNRAKRAANVARDSVLSKAITQPLKPLQ